MSHIYNFPKHDLVTYSEEKLSRSQTEFQWVLQFESQNNAQTTVKESLRKCKKVRES